MQIIDFTYYILIFILTILLLFKVINNIFNLIIKNITTY